MDRRKKVIGKNMMVAEQIMAHQAHDDPLAEVEVCLLVVLIAAAVDVKGDAVASVVAKTPQLYFGMYCFHDKRLSYCIMASSTDKFCDGPKQWRKFVSQRVMRRRTLASLSPASSFAAIEQ